MFHYTIPPAYFCIFYARFTKWTFLMYEFLFFYCITITHYKLQGLFLIASFTSFFFLSKDSLASQFKVSAQPSAPCTYLHFIQCNSKKNYKAIFNPYFHFSSFFSVDIDFSSWLIIFSSSFFIKGKKPFTWLGCTPVCLKENILMGKIICMILYCTQVNNFFFYTRWNLCKVANLIIHHYHSRHQSSSLPFIKRKTH